MSAPVANHPIFTRMVTTKVEMHSSDVKIVGALVYSNPKLNIPKNRKNSLSVPILNEAV